MNVDTRLEELKHVLYTGAPEARKEAVLEMYELGEAAAEWLAKALKDRDKGVRDAAFHGLSMIPSQAAARHLVPLLANKNIEIRNLASELLVRYGAVAKEVLLQALSDPDKDVRKFAVDILGLSGDRSVAEKMIPMLDDPEPNVAVSAAEALGNLHALEAVPALIQHYHACVGMEPVVLEALGKLNNAEADQFLVQVLDEGDPNLSFIALESLGQSEDPETARKIGQKLDELDELLRQEAFKAIFCILAHCNRCAARYFDFEKHCEEVMALLKEGDDKEAFYAIFDSLPDELILANLRDILEILNHPRDEIRYYVVERLKQMDVNLLLSEIYEHFEVLTPEGQLALLNLFDSADIEYAMPLLKQLARSPDPDIKIMVAQILAPQQVPEVEEIVKGFVDDPDQRVREAAYMVLSYRAHPGLIPLFEVGVRSSSPVICEASLLALASLDAGKVNRQIAEWMELDDQEKLLFLLRLVPQYPHLVPLEKIRELLRHTNAEIRAAAARAMQFFEPAEVWHELLALQQDADRDVALAAFQSLEKLAGEEQSEHIINALESGDFWVQSVALDVVARQNRMDLVPQVFPLLESSDRMVQIKAIGVLLQLMGEEGRGEIKEYLENLGEDADHLISLAREEFHVADE
ncbi:MAG: HEAT repeat domain-containing protein [Calditrichaeota bacterium]|nr:MAG: HEAT repeat domain-containing protein [Calditrichota bacterium]